MQDSCKNTRQADDKRKMQQNLSVIKEPNYYVVHTKNPYSAHRVQTGTEDAENGGRYMPI